MFHHSNEYKVCKDTVKDIISGLTILTEDRNIVNNLTSRSTNEIPKSGINGATFDNPDGDNDVSGRRFEEWTSIRDWTSI
jgi:hypothetical protein